MTGGLLAGKRRTEAGEGRTLRLLSALEVLEARREAADLAGEERERALCANACLLARALEKRGRPIYHSGAAVLAAMTAEEIVALARKWSRFRREENPSPEDGGERADAIKKAWSTRLMSAFAGACSARFRPCPPRSGSGT